MPFSSATFSMSSVRREKRPRMSGGNPRDLEIVAFAINSESEVLKPVGKPHAKRRLEVWGIPLEFAKLARFPAMLLLVPRRVEDEDMGVKLGIGQPVHRPRCRVDELRPDHVAAGAVDILAASTDARLHLRFHLAHGLIHRRPESTEDLLVARSSRKAAKRSWAQRR